MGSLKGIFRRFIAYKRAVVVGIIALLIVDGMQLVIPRIIKGAVDGLTNGTLGMPGLVRYALVVVGLALGIAGLRFYWRLMIIGTSRHIEEDLRNDIFSHLHRLSARYFAVTKTGDLMAHATNDIEAVRMACGIGVVALIDAVVLGLAAVGFMLALNVRLTLLALVPMPFVALFTLRAGKLLHQRFEKVQATFSDLTERVRESIAGIRVVKAYAQEPYELERLSATGREYIGKNIELVRVWGAFFPFITLLSSMSVVIVIYFGGRGVMFGSITTGDLVAFTSYLGILTWPMMAMGWVVNIMQRGAASMDRINRILTAEPEIADREGAVDPGKVLGDIRFDDVTLRYEAGLEPALRDVSFHVPAGTTLGVIGRTGSGKSTICNLIVRLYDATSGRVLIDGRDVTGLTVSGVRGAVGYVPQDTFLFSDTIRENIRFGALGATDEQVLQAARVSGILAEIEGFPAGLDTMVGERGVTLSGGQKQRVAIARGLVTEPAIVLLDDALSSVDTATEEAIQRELKDALRGRTVVVVSHRVSSIKGADQIVVLDEGRVVERGSHAELLKRRGLYASIHDRQLLEDELDQADLAG